MSTNQTNVITVSKNTYTSTSSSYDNAGKLRTQGSNVGVSNWKVTTTNRRGTTTPNFKGPVGTRPNPLPFNTFHFDREIQNRSVGSRSYGYHDYAGRYSTVISGCTGEVAAAYYASISASALSSANRTLDNMVLNRIKDQKVNLLQAYAERAQTARTIGSNLLALAKSFSALRRGDVVGASRHLGVSTPPRRGGKKRNLAEQELAQRWLELQYGWLPLLGDIHGAAEAYWKVRLTRPPRERVFARQTLYNDYTEVQSGNASYNSYYKGMTKTDISLVCWFAPDNVALKTFSELGITNPAMIAWELMPWSFVVDWFLPIGNAINSLDATLGVSFVGGCRTTFTRRLAFETKTYKKTSAYDYDYGTFESSKEFIEVDRSPLTSFPSPSLPSFKDPFSRLHFMNALSLFSTTFRK